MSALMQSRMSSAFSKRSKKSFLLNVVHWQGSVSDASLGVQSANERPILIGYQKPLLNGTKFIA